MSAQLACRIPDEMNETLKNKLDITGQSRFGYLLALVTSDLQPKLPPPEKKKPLPPPEKKKARYIQPGAEGAPPFTEERVYLNWYLHALGLVTEEEALWWDTEGPSALAERAFAFRTVDSEED